MRSFALFVQRVYLPRQTASESELFALGDGEGGSFIESRIVKELISTQGNAENSLVRHEREKGGGDSTKNIFSVFLTKC